MHEALDSIPSATKKNIINEYMHPDLLLTMAVNILWPESVQQVSTSPYRRYLSQDFPSQENDML
jgi:hypothetical protein